VLAARLLLLIPCGVGLSPPGGWSWTTPPLLALPVAGWIAARHGTRALPWIALALLPMELRWRGYIEPFGVTLGGHPGVALAALLVARFAADGAFRAARLGATTLRPWQIGALALLPLTYHSPLVYGFDLRLDMTPVALVLMALISLSRVPLGPPMAVMATAWAAMAALGVTVGELRVATAGSFLGYGLRAIPADLVTVLLGFGLFRMLRGAVAPGGPLLRLARDHPLWLAVPAALCGAALSLVFTPAPLSEDWRYLGLAPLGVAVTPLLWLHLLLLAVFLGARRTPARGLLAAGAAGLLVATLPLVTTAGGGWSLRLFGAGLASVPAGLLGLWAFFALARGLSARLGGEAQGAGAHPGFAPWPARAALALAALAALLPVLAFLVWRLAPR
jgi:hypothetical protein